MLNIISAEVDSQIAAGAVGAVLGAIFTAGGTWWVSVRLDRQRENRVLISAIAVVSAELEENSDRIKRLGREDLGAQELGRRLTLGDWATTKAALAGLALRDESLWKNVVDTYGAIYESKTSGEPPQAADLDDLRGKLMQEQERLQREIESFFSLRREPRSKPDSGSPAIPAPADRALGRPAPSVQLRVVQCNILHGGWPYEVRGRQLFVKRAGDDQAQEKNFTKLSYPSQDPLRGDPGSAFASLMQTLRPDVIGMQEVDSRDIERLLDLLGPEWRNTPPLDGNAASCIFWNSATVEALPPEEVAVVQTFVNPEGKKIPIRVLKQFCVHTESQKHFAVVTGKAWYQGSTQDRKIRAAHTRDFARRGGLTTVIAIDMSPPKSPAFAAMAPFVAKGSEKTCPAGVFEGRPGSKSNRTDHVFYYSPLIRGPQKDGIIQCVTGPFFGSDHLCVWADVKLP
jgi:hypothetical protein